MADRLDDPGRRERFYEHHVTVCCRSISSARHANTVVLTAYDASFSVGTACAYIPLALVDLFLQPAF